MTRHLITTTAQQVPCPGCGDPILRGIAEGLSVVVELGELAGDELGVLLTGARTFTLSPHKELIYRDAGRIRSGRLRGTIHAEHMCQHPTLL